MRSSQAIDGLCVPVGERQSAKLDLDDCPISISSNMLSPMETSLYIYKLPGFHIWKLFGCALYKPYKPCPSPL